VFDGCLYFNTTALARQLERSWARAFAPFGLTPPQAFMLRTVLARPGLLQREVAEAMVISRPTATRTLDGLAGKGLVERRASGRDGREQELHPTAAARAIHPDLDRASAEVTRRLKRLLGEKAFAGAVGRIRGVRAALDSDRETETERSPPCPS
jgi:DNA-binding MarR family transcriptional regulator